MREFDELGFSERDIKFLEAHGLDTDRHMTTNEEVQKLFNAVLDMTEDELHEAMERYIPMPPMPEVVNPAVYAEYQEKRRIRQMLVWYPTVAKLAEEGNWEEFILRVSGIYELMPAVFRPDGLCEDAPDDIYRKLLVACYEHHGDGLLSVRARITDLPRRGAEALPPEYADADVITVYRAAEEDPEDSAASLSWTIKREVAEFFMYEYDKRHARYLLEAKLDVADVIDYTDARNEAEVLQDMAVYDVRVLDELDE